MTKPNIIYKDEKRFLWRDPDASAEAGQQAILFAILESKLEEAHPVHGTALFQIAVNAQLVTRKQLQGLRDLIDEALSNVLEGRIVMVPPGARIGPQK